MAWNKPTSSTVNATSSSRSAGRGKTTRLRGLYLVLGVIAIALGMLCFFLFSDGDNEPKPKADKGRGRIKEVKIPPAREKSPEELVRELPERAPKLKAGERVAQPRERKAIVKPLSGPAKWLQDARARGERPIFEFEVENFLATYSVPGEEVPPVPIDEGMKQSFVNSLVTPIVISENDPPDVVQKKEMVAAMKEEMKEYIKAGGTFEGYFKELEKRQAHEVNIKNDAQTMFTQMLDDGDDDEAAVVFWRKANQKLTDLGISTLPLHPRLRPLLPKDELDAYDASIR